MVIQLHCRASDLADIINLPLCRHSPDVPLCNLLAVFYVISKFYHDIRCSSGCQDYFADQTCSLLAVLDLTQTLICMVNPRSSGVEYGCSNAVFFHLICCPPFSVTINESKVLLNPSQPPYWMICFGSSLPGICNCTQVFYDVRFEAQSMI